MLALLYFAEFHMDFVQITMANTNYIKIAFFVTSGKACYLYC